MMGGLLRLWGCFCLIAYHAVKLPLATFDKKSVDCKSRRDCSAGDSRVPRDGGGYRRSLF